MKLIVIWCCISLILVACNVAKPTKLAVLDIDKISDDFTFINANVQYSTLGQRSDRYSDYYVYLIVKANADDITFDSAWSNERSYETFISTNNPIISADVPKIKTADTIIVRISAKQEIQEQQKPHPPINYTGAILFRYYLNKSPHYFSIKNFTKLESPKLQ